YPPGIGINTFGFPVTPAALYWGPRFFHERYRLPILITENGVCISDWIARDGKVHDPQRIDFLGRYLLELRRAIRGGADVRGYFWSTSLALRTSATSQTPLAYTVLAPPETALACTVNADSHRHAGRTLPRNRMQRACNVCTPARPTCTLPGRMDCLAPATYTH